jgi:hypothetical protein
MTTVQAFNTMLKNFLEELVDVFPEETQIKAFLDGFDGLTALNARAPLDMFIGSLAPHTDLAMAKNPELFAKLEFPGGIDFGKLWASDISDNTREAIWQYINLLFLLGTTVRSMPPEMLQGIESVAQNCADQIQSGQLDFSALGGMLMNGGLGNLGGLGDLGALAGLGGGTGAGAPPGGRTPAGRRKNKKT